MVFISKNDKKTWQDYIDNFEHFTLNLKKDDLKKEVKINEKNSITKNNIANSYKLFKKGKIKPDGVIDLHGYSLKVGKQNLESYILKSYENNLRNILVITGKGINNQGVLKKEVPVWLEEKKIKNYLRKSIIETTLLETPYLILENSLKQEKVETTLFIQKKSD